VITCRLRLARHKSPEGISFWAFFLTGIGRRLGPRNPKEIPSSPMTEGNYLGDFSHQDRDAMGETCGGRG